MIAAPYFLRYMNDALNYYENTPRVISIHGYTYPVGGLPETFFMKGADCWGWATWKGRWKLFEALDISLHEEEVVVGGIAVEENEAVLKAVSKYLQSITPSLYSRIKNKLRHLKR